MRLIILPEADVGAAMSALLASLPHPVIAAPMAGGPSTPALVAAVSRAGGFGFLAAGYLTPDRLAADIAETRRLTARNARAQNSSGQRPFGVNLFAPLTAAVDSAAISGYADQLRGEAQRWGVAPAVVSFAFGLPDRGVVDRLHERGCEVWATVTRPAEAAEAVALGADALVVQGIEAGAHRGGTDDADEYALLPLLRLVAARVPVPLVAAGGIGDGPALAAVLAAGAAAGALGTAFLRCPEAGTSAVHRAALAGTANTGAGDTATGGTGTGDAATGDAAPIRDTALTRAFTGRVPAPAPAPDHRTAAGGRPGRRGPGRGEPVGRPGVPARRRAGVNDYTNLNLYLEDASPHAYLDYCRPRSCMFNIQWQQFQVTADDSRLVLRSDSAVNVAALRADVGSNLDKTGAIYLNDEPYGDWNERRVSTADLQTATDQVRQNFPGVPLMLTLDGVSVVVANPQPIPQQIDMVGFDSYCQTSGTLTTILNTLQGRLTAYQHMYLIPESTPTLCGGSTDASIAAQQSVYQQIAANKPTGGRDAELRLVARRRR